MGTPIDIAILPYLQAWRSNTTSSFLDIRLLSTPRGSPVDPLDGATGVSFAAADFKLEVHVLPGDDLPTLTGTPLLTIVSPALPNSLALFKELANQLAAKGLSIDPNPPKAQRPPGSLVRKFLPPSYQNAVNYIPGKANNLVTTGSDYCCALKMNGIGSSYTPLDPPSSKIAWGQVIANLLRTPILAEAAGLVRPLSIQIADPTLVKNGGFLFITLGTGSPKTGAMKIYATRFPSLLPGKSRKLYSPVFFPVLASPAPGNYVKMFAEIEDYDDGWAKAVHCTQPEQLNRVKQDVSNDIRPVKEMGIELGWDDEQVTIWTNRQLADTGPDAALDVPPGTAGYAVDVRQEGTTNWHSLVTAEGKFVLGIIDLGGGVRQMELPVPINPVRPFAEKNRGISTGGTFWLPIYYTRWTGPALVLDDELAVILAGGKAVPAGNLKATNPGATLTYGKSYDFQVRFMDHTGGGPQTNDPHITPGPSPIATQLFKRFIVPLAPTIASTVPAKPALFSPFTAITQISVNRPLLQYPAVVCTGKYTNAQNLLKQDVQVAAAAGREPGLPDPDVDRLVITVEAESFPHDPLATDGSFQPIFVTTRPFPTDPTFQKPLLLDIQWQDQANVATHRAGAESQTSGPLTLPTARTLRIRIAATCTFNNGYFGDQDVCTGPSIYVTARKDSTDERNLFTHLLPSEQFSAYFLQPDVPSNQAAPVPAPNNTGNPAALLLPTASSIAAVAPSDIASRFAAALGFRVVGSTMKPQTGNRVVFGCASGLRGIIAPDGSSITFGTKIDLGLRWLTVLRLLVTRDWTWDGFQPQAISISRDGNNVGTIKFPRVASQDAISAASAGGVDPRATTEIVFIDSINPLPPPGTFPQTLNPKYVVTPMFQGSPTADPPFTISIELPVTTPPSQVPTLASAGIAMAPYVRDQAPNYTFSEPRQKLIWLELTSPLADPHDAYFARVLRNVPDPLLGVSEVELQPLPGLPIDPELVRQIVQGEANDSAGLNAMTQLIPSDETPTTRFALPLPVDTRSPELFGFWTYELRVGHTNKIWSTAQGRFGSPLLVNGIQHPPPQLTVKVQQTTSGITASAPHAVSSFRGSVVAFAFPRTTLWFMIYVQATQVDGADSRNILLLPPVQGKIPAPGRERRPLFSDSWASAVFDNTRILSALAGFGFDSHAKLSVMAVEMTASGTTPIIDPLAADLGRQRILRTSGLTAVPQRC